MGLDQYLTISEYIPRTTRDDLRPDTPKANPVFEELVNRRPSWVDKGAYQGISVRYPAGQWRKANGIHNWFVTKVQDGRDECQQSYVSGQQLRELRDACEQVVFAHVNDTRTVHKVAQEVGLTTIHGSFFGSTEYDEWYIEDLRYTMRLVNRLETSGVFDNAWVDIYYQASW